MTDAPLRRSPSRPQNYPFPVRRQPWLKYLPWAREPDAPRHTATRFEGWAINGANYAFALVEDAVIGVWGPESMEPETPATTDVLAHDYTQELEWEAQRIHDGHPLEGVTSASRLFVMEEMDVYRLRSERRWSDRQNRERMFLPSLFLWLLGALFVGAIARQFLL